MSSIVITHLYRKKYTVVNKMIEPPMLSEIKLFLLQVHFNNFNNNFIVHIGIQIE